MDAIIVNQLSDEDAVTVEIKIGSLNIIAASMYFDIQGNLELDLIKAQKILNFAKGKGILFVIDSNSRSCLWHDAQTNRRGKTIEEFMIGHNLFILNKDTLLPMFQTIKGSSRIDLTICNDQLIKEAHN